MPYPLRSPFYNPYGPSTTFVVAGVQPPADRYLGPSDQLLLTVWNPSVDVSLDFGSLQLNLKGEVAPTEKHYDIPANPALPTLELLDAAEGFLLSAIVTIDAAQRGQCFVQISVQRNLGGNNNAKGTVLAQGYVSTTDAVGFPQTPVESSLNGAGWLRTFTIPDPAAGSEFVITVPTGVRWKLLNQFATLTTSGAGGSRFQFVRVVDAAAQLVGRWESGRLWQHDLTITYNKGPYGYESSANSAGFDQNDIGLTPIGMLLTAGYTLTSETDNLDAADQYSGVGVQVEEYIDF